MLIRGDEWDTRFQGTRVPIQTLIDHLEAGDSLDIFLADFPSVTRDQAVAVLELAKDTLLAGPSEGVTDALNRIYGEEDSSLDPGLARLQAASLPRDKW